MELVALLIGAGIIGIIVFAFRQGQKVKLNDPHHRPPPENLSGP
jgi:hypothetical protein